jgi:serine/threonine-protein kinase
MGTTTDERTEIEWQPDATQATPAPPSEDVEIPRGTMLGDYRVEGRIGQGGMGIVLSAIHPLIGKRAAIKVLKAALCTDPTSIERFVDEARVVNQIGHPNIVDVFTFGTAPDGRSYLVMEWLQGETLRERIARSRPLLPEICEIVQPLVRALAAAHACQVIHRDLKPDNVFLVTVPGERHLVKLLDFGIAKLVRNDATSVASTASGVLVGTPLYAAPEQAKGLAIDHRVDIYALGGLVFELLTGRPPFSGTTAMEVIAKHLIEIPPRASALARVPRELDDLVFAMLAKDPAARPALAEIASVLERVSRGTTPMAIERDSHDSIAVTTRRAVPDEPRSHQRIAIIALIASILAIGAISIYLGRSAPEPRPAPRLSVTPIAVDAMPADTTATIQSADAGLASTPAPSPRDPVPAPRPAPPQRPAKPAVPHPLPAPAPAPITDPRLIPHS